MGAVIPPNRVGSAEEVITTLLPWACKPPHHIARNRRANLTLRGQVGAANKGPTKRRCMSSPSSVAGM